MDLHGLVLRELSFFFFTVYVPLSPAEDRLCGLVVRVLGYRFGGPGFDSQALQDFPTKKKKENK
jgi:hypothetical protein